MNALFTGMEWFPDCQDGGLNRYFYQQVQAMPAVGVGGRALVSSLRAGQSAAMDVEAMAPEGADLWHRLAGAKRAFRTAIEKGIELVNAHFSLYAFAGLRYLPERLPLVVHFHGPYADEMLAERGGMGGRVRARIARYVEREVLRRARRVITLSEAFAAIARERYGVPVDRIRVIPGGLDMRPYMNVDRSLARQRLSWPADRPILVCVRRLARRMGIEGLIDAVSDVRREHPDVLLMIGGKGELTVELQQRIDRGGLQNNVQLLGFVPEEQLPWVYAAADVAIVPTITLEGFGLITVEALASGTPVLGTPVGGTPEILTPLDPNLVFASTRPTDMAQRIDAVLASRVRLPDADQCRAYARRFDWDQVAGRIKQVFEEARYS
jgi:glycosyltransferase involved in cell wall biosynthesis